jgi:hypothetical protein
LAYSGPTGNDSHSHPGRASRPNPIIKIEPTFKIVSYQI